MNRLLFLRLSALVLMLLATGCSTIKSWFPDKERDYQFTTEIPELIVPDDLKKGGPGLMASRPAAPVQAVEQADAEVVAVANDTGESSAPVAAETVDENPIQAAPSSTASSLQIDQSRLQAARIVARAMTRQKLEIVERNIEKGYFYVKFDPNAVQAKDEDILDELNFIFGDDPSAEQEYRVSLREISPQMSEVTVQNSDGKQLSSAAANALLKLITDGINQDIAKPASESEGQPPSESDVKSPVEPVAEPVTATEQPLDGAQVPSGSQ